MSRVSGFSQIYNSRDLKPRGQRLNPEGKELKYARLVQLNPSDLGLPKTLRPVWTEQDQAQGFRETAAFHDAGKGMIRGHYCLWAMHAARCRY